MPGPSLQSWQLPSSPLSRASLSWAQMPRETSLTSTFRCQSDHPSSLPETRRGLKASQKRGPLDSFQCAELSDHKREAWSTQMPTVFGATARRSIFVTLWEVRCLADWALHPNHQSVSTKVAAASVAPHHGRLRRLSLVRESRSAACVVSRSGLVDDVERPDRCFLPPLPGRWPTSLWLRFVLG